MKISFVEGMSIDFVTFTMKYDCWNYKESNTGWSKSEVPVLLVESDLVTDSNCCIFGFVILDVTRILSN
jgi:hypothetical protein